MLRCQKNGVNRIEILLHLKKIYSEWLNAKFQMPQNETIINSAPTEGRRSEQMYRTDEEA